MDNKKHLKTCHENIFILKKSKIIHQVDKIPLDSSLVDTLLDDVPWVDIQDAHEEVLYETAPLHV